MFGAIARFELRYQLRNPRLPGRRDLVLPPDFGAMTVPQIQIGGGNVHKNAATALARTHISMSIFFMSVTTAFVSNVVVRDDESGFGAMVRRTTRVTKASYLLARFGGAFGAAATAFLVVPLAMWLGSLMP